MKDDPIGASRSGFFLGAVIVEQSTNQLLQQQQQPLMDSTATNRYYLLGTTIVVALISSVVSCALFLAAVCFAQSCLGLIVHSTKRAFLFYTVGDILGYCLYAPFLGLHYGTVSIRPLEVAVIVAFSIAMLYFLGQEEEEDDDDDDDDNVDGSRLLKKPPSSSKGTILLEVSLFLRVVEEKPTSSSKGTIFDEELVLL